MRHLAGPSRIEHRVVLLAEQQEGVISVRQLRELGAGADWVKRRTAMGWLRPVFHEVYAIGHPPRTRRGWYRAALRAVTTAP